MELASDWPEIVLSQYTGKRKMKEERLWVLIARKLTGEASEKDLAELSILLQGNPEAGNQFKVLSNYWGCASKNPGSPVPGAFEKLLAKINNE
ncbi:MAG: hypothetical protein Q8938_13210 [Bacteroidota bacterium]|nr:hypothetical protein [Bacteroidota bacterium]MDP4258075.1 hypothetical protein [Bacteroidota bacterium]